MLAHGLARRGCRVSVLTRRSVPGSPGRERDGDVAVRRLPPGGSGPTRKWALSAPAFGAVLSAHGEFDVLVTLGFRVLGAPVVTAGGLLGLPVVLKAESRGELSGEFFRPGLERRGLSLASAPVRAALEVRNRILRRAAAFVAMSSELEREFLGEDIPAERIHRIPNAVDVERFTPVDRARRSDLRRELGVPAGARLLVYTGRLVDYKGLPELIEIWPRVRQAHSAAHLVLVGEGGSDQAACEEELRRRVDVLGIARSVRFTGAVADVVPWLQAADGFVFPSAEEAFGLSLVEAMACGLPVVTTDVGGLSDIATPDEDALVLPVGDRDALLDAVNRLVEGGTEIAQLGERARRSVESRFAEGPVIDAWWRLLSRVTEDR
jgi:glycosyltransferase involved in cell wall biosynthesis